MQLSSEIRIFALLNLVAVVGLCASAVTATKIVAIGPFVFPCSNIIFSLLTFPITDIISEVWGQRYAKITVWLSFAAQAGFVLLIQGSIYVPAADMWTGQESYAHVLGNGPRILIASFVAFLTSQFWDVIVYSKLKQLTRGRWLWLRNNISTFSSQLINSALFISIAFGGSLPIGELILGSMALKWLIAAIDTPLVYVGVHMVNRTIGKSSLAYTAAE
jgi:uncharacterized integral membrane protein (TIGR00697 family)